MVIFDLPFPTLVKRLGILTINSNIYQETWNDDNSPPEGWIIRNPTVGLNLTLAEGWREDNILPARWTTRDNNITVRRDNRCILASKLPTIFVTNHRSFFPKFHNFLEVMHTLELTLGLHSEIWEDKGKKDAPSGKDISKESENPPHSDDLDKSSDSNICVRSDYFPYSSEIINDNTHLLSNSNIYQETWNDDNSPPEGWIIRNPTVGLNLTLAEGWREDNILPARWTTRDNNITVRRDNRCILASKLPTIFVTNHRSFFPKFHNFLEVMHTLELTLGLHSEIWEDKEKKDHKDKIEEALELQGIDYISNTRPRQSVPNSWS